MQRENRVLMLVLILSGLVSLILSGILVYRSTVTTNSQASTIDNSLIPSPIEPSLQCGKTCTSDSQCGGLKCGKICEGSKCFRENYCHNPRCPEYTFIAGWTGFDDYIDIPRGISGVVAQTQYCKDLTISGNPKQFLIDSNGGEIDEDEADALCTQKGKENNLQHCSLDHYYKNDKFFKDRKPANYACTCREIPFEETRRCDYDSGYNKCKCNRNRSMKDAAATSCDSCGGFGKIPVCSSNSLSRETDTEIEYDEQEETNPFLKNKNGQCARHVKRIVCSDGRVLEDLYGECYLGSPEEKASCSRPAFSNVEGTYEDVPLPEDMQSKSFEEKLAYCKAQKNKYGQDNRCTHSFTEDNSNKNCSCFVPAPTPSDVNTNTIYARFCVDKTKWEDLAKTFCNAPYLEKRQCLRTMTDRVTCDKMCGSLYGKKCEEQEGGGNDDYYFKCCPENPELDSLWNWAYFKFDYDTFYKNVKVGGFQECPRGERIQITPGIPLNPPIIVTGVPVGNQPSDLRPGSSSDGTAGGGAR